jgi:hypothetical protein
MEENIPGDAFAQIALREINNINNLAWGSYIINIKRVTGI